MDERVNITEQAIRQLKEYMDEHRMRRTPERFEVLKAVCQMPGIFSIDELAQFMSEQAEFNVSRVTIFNTMNLLEKAHIVVRHTLAHTAHYECCMRPKAHICTVCTICGKVQNIEKPAIAAALADIKVRLFTVTQPVLYLHGICRTCSMAESKRRKAQEKATAKKKSNNNNIQQKQ